MRHFVQVGGWQQYNQQQQRSRLVLEVAPKYSPCHRPAGLHYGDASTHASDQREKAVIEQTKMTTSTAQTHSSISAIYLEYFNASARF